MHRRRRGQWFPAERSIAKKGMVDRAHAWQAAGQSFTWYPQGRSGDALQIFYRCLGLALLNFLHIRANIDRDAFHPPVRFVVLLTILASLIGLFLTRGVLTPDRVSLHSSHSEWQESERRLSGEESGQPWFPRS